MTAAAAREDFDLMRQALEEAHSGLYRYSSKAEIDRVFDAARAKLDRPMSKRQFLVVTTEALTPIRCGHTGVRPDDGLGAAMKEARSFPLRVLPEGARLKVLFNDTADDRTIRPGMEVVEINGAKAADVLARCLRLEASDGDIESGRRAHVANGFARYYWATVDPTDRFTVKARDAAGKVVTARLAGVTEAERKANQNPVNETIRAGIDKVRWTHENQALRFLKDPDVANARINYFVGDDFPRWVEETFKTLHDKGTKTLVLDLRGNGGGNDMYGAMLVSCLTDKPFRYFDRIHVKTITPAFKAASDWNGDDEHLSKLRENMTPDPAGGFLVTEKGHPGIAQQQPGKFPFLGNVFVLIDGGTFSTAADFCAVVHHLKRATFVGEETGGGYYGNNSGLQAMVTLPNSGFQVRVPMSEYWNAVPGYDGKRRGTRPDHPVETTTSALLEGKDQQLECALKLAERHSK
jgi:C-terminal processing protease CtpA/Prc